MASRVVQPRDAEFVRMAGATIPIPRGVLGIAVLVLCDAPGPVLLGLFLGRRS